MAWMALSFKTAPDGKKVYFPWSTFGPGYEVADEAQEEAIHQYNGISTLIELPLVIATGIAWKTDADLIWRLAGLVLVAAGRTTAGQVDRGADCPKLISAVEF